MRIFNLFLVLTILFSASFAYEGEQRVEILDNGLTVILKETHIVPMVSMQAWVRAGSITERDHTGSGLSHYFEHMLFKGTKKRGPGEIAQAIHAAGGADFNAYTSFEKTVYHFTVLNEYMDTGLDVLADMLMNSQFDEEEAEKELKVILNEINMSVDKPDTAMYWKMLATAYQQFPYRYPILGHEELFRKLTRKDILYYYDLMYSPSNTILSLVGSFPMEEMIEKVQHYFGLWPRKMLPPLVLPEEPRQISPRRLEYEAEVNNSRMYLAYKSVDLYHEDAYALDCLSFVLGIGPTSRLHQRLVEKDKIAYSASTGNWTPLYPGLFLIRANFETENFTKVRFAIQQEMDRFKYELVSQKELEIVKNNVLASTIFGEETIASQADSLASSYFYCGNLDRDKVYAQGINRVTAQDIKRVAAKYLINDSLTLVHMKPKKDKVQLAKTGIPPMKIPDVTIKNLDNGIKVILMEDHKLPIISATAGFFGGLITENINNCGISSLAATMLKKGTKKFSKQDIIDIEMHTGCDFRTSSGNNTIFVSTKTLVSTFDRAWPVFTSMITENKFKDLDYDLEKDIRLAAIKRSQEDNGYRNNVLYRKHIFKGHPYEMEMQGTEKSIGAMTGDHIRDHIAKHIVADNMTIAVVGDFKSDEMFKNIEKAFSGMKKTGFKLPPRNKPAQIRGVNEYKDILPDKRQSVVRLVFRGVDFHNEDKYVLSVISTMLSGLGSRLFENLRSKHSLAYSVGAGGFNGIDTGAYAFYISTTPDKREFALQKMREEIEILKKEPVGAEELAKTITKIVGADSGKFQSTLSVSEDLVLDEMYGIGYKAMFESIEKIKKVTKDDIIRVARKYFDLENCIIAVVEP